MEKEKEFVKKEFIIDKTVNEETGEVTLFFKDEKMGPVITGKDEEEAKAKFLEALKVSLIVGSIMEIDKLLKDNNFGEAFMKEKASSDAKRLTDAKKCLEYENNEV